MYSEGLNLIGSTFSGIDFYVAASGITLLDYADLSGDSFTHGICVTYHANLLSLRCLEHCQRIDHGFKGIRVESAESLIDKEVFKTDIS